MQAGTLITSVGSLSKRAHSGAPLSLSLSLYLAVQGEERRKERRGILLSPSPSSVVPRHFRSLRSFLVTVMPGS